jgi:hypothetical protein
VVSQVDKEMRAVTKSLLLLWIFITLRGKERIYFYVNRKAIFLSSDNHGKNSYCEVEMKSSCCNLASITLLLKSCYLHSIEFGQHIKREFLVVKMRLVWMNSTCRQKHLCSMFAMTQDCVSYFLGLVMACLNLCRHQLSWARIEWASSEKLVEFCSMI